MTEKELVEKDGFKIRIRLKDSLLLSRDSHLFIAAFNVNKMKPNEIQIPIRYCRMPKGFIERNNLAYGGLK